jgi:hypothetical protein
MGETQYIKPVDPRSTHKLERLRAEYEVFSPKVHIRNNVFPFPEDYHNCQTCRESRLLQRPEPGVIKVKCILQADWIEENEGIIDNGCPGHRRKIPRKDI